MSFGSSKHLPIEKPKLFGAQPEQVDTHEAARVVPFFSGTRWVGVTWLGDVFGVRTTPVRKKVGKRKATVGYNYYAGFCGLVGIGPADLITNVSFDDTEVWSGSVSRGSEDYTSLTIENRGVLHVLWGTETATLHSVLAGSGIDHSPMRGQIAIIGEDMLLGQDRTTVPNIKLRIGRYPRPSWISAGISKIGDDVNPVIALWDWWKEVRAGARRSEALLDTVRLASVAQTLYDEGLGISPLLTTEDELKGFLVRLLETCDAYPTSYDGKFGLGLVRTTGASIPQLDYSDFTADPSIQTQLWPDTYSEVRVKFQDDELNGEANSARYQDLANFQITGVRKPRTVERPFVTSYNVAHKIASAVGKVSALPQVSGSGTIRESSAASIDIGTVFDFLTRDGETLRLRCTGKTDEAPDKRRISIEFESDRGWANQSTHHPDPESIPDTPVIQPYPAAENEVMNAPYALAINGQDSDIYLAARGDEISTAFDVHRASASAGPYLSAAESHLNGNLFNGFATCCQLLSDYSASTPLLDEWVKISFEVIAGDEDILAEEFTSADAYSHELLALFTTEIMALWGIQRTGESRYTAKTLRGLYDRLRSAHLASEVFWIQTRQSLAVDAWPPSVSSTRYFKFQPSFGPSEASLSGITAVAYAGNFRPIRPLRPCNLRANGDGSHPYWQTGSPVVLTWDNSSRERSKFGVALNEVTATDLTHIKIEVRSYDESVLRDTLTVDATSGTTTLTDAYLVGAVNADFALRAYGVKNGLESLEYESVKVDKV